MPITYPEGGMPGLLLKQRRMAKPTAIDTFKVQLVPLRAAPKAKISGPEDVVSLVREMEDYDRESAKLIHMDTKNQVMGVETISIGSLNMSIVHPRETVKGAILNNSANVIFVHNHPSGICEPSNEDVEITGKLKEAFETVSIALLDSIIVGKGCHYSLREAGVFSREPETRVKTVEEPRKPIKDLPWEERIKIAKGIAATTGPPLEPGKYITFEDISKMPPEERKKHLKMIAAGQIQSSAVKEPQQDVADKVQFIGAMTEYITAPDMERRKRAAAKLQASKHFKNWFDKFFYVHDPQSAKDALMQFFVANEQGLGAVNYAYFGVIADYLRAISKPVLAVREAGQSGQPMQKYVKEYQDFMKKEEAGLRQKLDKITADTSKPIPESMVIGAAAPMNGHLTGYHLTDNPDEVVSRLKSDNLAAMNPHGDLGGGLYISNVPEYWRARSRGKWEFAKSLSKAQRQSLVNVILADPRYRKGGGYLADFEVDRMHRDLNMYVETGDVTYLALTGDQPYNVRITAETTKKAGVPPPREPGLVFVELSGKFIDAAGLYSHPLRDEVINRARAWAVINRPDLMGFTLNTKNVVNAWLDSMGYSGMFTRSGMSTNPEMVIWNRKAIVGYRAVT